jgi:hypothetical protein
MGVRVLILCNPLLWRLSGGGDLSLKHVGGCIYVKLTILLCAQVGVYE